MLEAETKIKEAADLRLLQSEVVAIVLPANSPSLRVAQKAGLAEAGRVEHVGFDHVLFRLEPASQW